MSTAKGTINAGVCGFVTQVTATCDDGQNVSFVVESPCEKIQALGAALPTVDAYAEIGAGFDGQVLSTVRAVLGGCCAGCVVPAGVFKAMQVAAKLALPASSGVQLERS
ncbi:MAG: hypothetical protein ABFE08_06195 [Armatimonadia bacterium]